MDEATRLAKKLREARQILLLLECNVWGLNEMDEAADELERLAAEVERLTPKAIHYGHEAVCELTKMADRFDHPDKFSCDWHKKAAKVLEALSLAISKPGNDPIDQLVHIASSLLREKEAPDA